MNVKFFHIIKLSERGQQSLYRAMHTHTHTHTACNHRRSRGRHMQFRWICIKCISGFILIYHDFEWDAKRHPVGRLNILLFVSVQRSELKRCKVDLKLWIIFNFSTKRIGVDDFVDACPPSPFSQFTHECFFFSQFRLFLWVHFPNHLEVTEGWGMHRIRKNWSSTQRNCIQCVIFAIMRVLVDYSKKS